MHLHYSIVLALTELALRILATQKNHLIPYFYHNGTQICHCDPHKQCSDNGICPSQTCRHDFIGHTCQHLRYGIPSSSLALDFDDSTCLPGPFNNGSVEFRMKSPAHFIWVYILTLSAITVNPVLGLFLGNDTTNLNIDPYYMRINSKSLVIKVRQDVFYNSLSLANLPTDICSFYISRGRNLAISSDPDQSSVLAGLSMSKKQNARSAIDGSEDRSFNPPGSTSCTHSQDPAAKSEWWRTRLKHDAVVNTVFIANRDKFECRLRDFTLETFTSINTRSFEYLNDISKAQYLITVSSRQLVREVKISVQKNSTSPTPCTGRGILTLCEVEIYGEFRCATDYYGPLCDIHCPHCIADLCDPDWGCTKCKGDWTGEWCNTRCKPGFQGKNCTDPCPTGTFGANCSELCVNCKKSRTLNKPLCHPVTGRCDLGCEVGFTGDVCNRKEKKRGFGIMAFLLKYGLHIVGISGVNLLLVFGFIYLTRAHNQNDEHSPIQSTKHSTDMPNQEAQIAPDIVSSIQSNIQHNLEPNEFTQANELSQREHSEITDDDIESTV